MSKNTGTKRKLFGSVDLTPGQNLVNALDLFKIEEHPYGILEHDYPTVIKIFEAALNDEEFDFLTRGFGFGREVQFQNKIAEELGVEAKYVSKVSHNAVNVKLQRAPYLQQLKALVPTVEEINTLVEKGLANDDAKKQLGEYRYRLKAAKEATDRAISEKDKAEQETVRVERELRSAETELKKVTAERDAAQQRILVLEAEIAKMKSGNEVARERMRAVYERMESIIFQTDSNEESANSSAGIDSLGLSPEAMQALRRVGINDLETLCNITKHSLNKLGVGQKNVEEIRLAMKRKSLSLKN